MSSSKCATCSTTACGDWLMCRECQRWYHGQCLQDGTYQFFASCSRQIPFICTKCCFVDYRSGIYNFTAALLRLAKYCKGKYRQAAEIEKILMEFYGIKLPVTIAKDYKFNHAICGSSMDVLVYYNPVQAMSYVPLVVYGDGNCFYRAVSLGLYGNSDHHVYFRLLTAIEVMLHKSTYDCQSLRVICPYGTLPYDQLVEQVVTLGEWQDIISFYACSAAIKTVITSFYPSTTLETPVLSCTVRGRDVRPTPPAVRIMWTTMKFDSSQSFVPNHFVTMVATRQPNEEHVVLSSDNEGTPPKKKGKSDEDSKDHDYSVPDDDVVPPTPPSPGSPPHQSDKCEHSTPPDHTTYTKRDDFSPSPSYSPLHFDGYCTPEDPDELSDDGGEIFKDGSGPQIDEHKKYVFVENGSNREETCLLDKDGYKYLRKTINYAADFSTWRCSKRPLCKAVVKHHNDGTFSVNGAKHNHSGNLQILGDITLRKKVKSLSQIKTFTAGQVVQLAQDQLRGQNLTAGLLSSTENNLKRAVSTKRKKYQPSHPKTLDFTIPDTYTTSLQDTGLIFEDIPSAEDGQRHLLLTSKSLLDCLRSRKQWFCDGTFKVVREPFKQLYTIHGFIKQGELRKQVPLMMVIMSRRRSSDYITVLERVKNLIGEGRSLKQCTMDFEQAAWKAFRTVFADVHLTGCQFHHRQSVIRQVRKIPGWITQYRHDEATQNFIRQLLALSILPAEGIDTALGYLENKYQEPEAVIMLRYYRRVWVDGWGPKNFSGFKRRIRTNNDVEGWHNLINTAGHQRMNLWALIDLLYKEVIQSQRAIKQMNMGYSSRRRNKACSKAERALFEAFSAFEQTNDLKALLRFGTKQASMLGFEAIESLSDEDDDSTYGMRIVQSVDSCI